LRDSALVDRHERRREASRARILDAALELFRTQGLEATTIEQICARADVANRTFFNHFPTRRDMVRALADARMRNLHDVLAERRDEPAPDRLIRFFDDVAEHLERSGETYREVIGAMIAETGTGADRSSDVYATFLELVKEGVAGADITDRHPPETLADVIVGSLVGGLVNWSADDTYSIRTGLHDVAVALADLLAPDTAPDS
jgi:AcrR family transcriptional regulator